MAAVEVLSKVVVTCALAVVIFVVDLVFGSRSREPKLTSPDRR